MFCKNAGMFLTLKYRSSSGNPDSDKAKYSDLVICMPKIQEACPLDLAPTSSTTAETVIGDALAVVASMIANFKENFALYHPAGSIGKKLLVAVEEIMHTGERMPIVVEGTLLKDALVEITKKRFGAAIITNERGEMSGIITNGDIRRALEKSMDIYLSVVEDIMTANPVHAKKEMLAVQALQLMTEGERSVAVLPILGDRGVPEGIILNHDIIRHGIIL